MSRLHCPEIATPQANGDGTDADIPSRSGAASSRSFAIRDRSILQPLPVGTFADATISVDAKKVFKPSPEAYALIELILGVAPREVLFVSSNPWDACGAKAFGLTVAWIERVTPEALARACVDNAAIAPLTMFRALRTQMDELGAPPDHRIHSLSELPRVVAFHES